MRRLARPLALVAAAWAAALPAQAQAPEVQLAPSPAVACMTPAPAVRGEPEYPFAPWKRGEGGKVLVKIVFTGAALEPEVKLIDSSGDAALVDAVKAHVSTFRVPCLDDAQLPVRLRQEYVFIPDTRKAVWSAAADMADPARREKLKCMATNDGSKSPEYPAWARRAETQGNVLARLKFTAPDRAPEVVLHTHTRMTRDLGAAVDAWAQRLRLPCLDGGPVSAHVVFLFRMEGATPVGFRNVTFLQFLRMVKDLDRQQAAFDTHAMGCPFDVRLHCYQPYTPNVVGQLADPDPRRQPLLEWLSTLTLALEPRQMDAVIGDSATLTVPCVKIDLKPKEKSS